MINAIRITPPLNYHGSFILNVTGYSKATENPTPASITKQMNVTFAAKNDKPAIISPVKIFTQEEVSIAINKPFPVSISV